MMNYMYVHYSISHAYGRNMTKRQITSALCAYLKRIRPGTRVVVPKEADSDTCVGVMLKPNTHRRSRRDSTVELSRVGGAAWMHLLEVVTHFTVSCAVELLRLVSGDKWQHNDVIVEKLTMIIDQNSRSQTAMESQLSNQFPNCRPNPSAFVVS